MVKIVIYTTAYCPYCRAAKKLLDQKGVEYEEVDLTRDPQLKERTMKELGWRTVPIVVVDGTVVGGFTELLRLEREKRLDTLLYMTNRTDGAESARG